MPIWFKVCIKMSENSDINDPKRLKRLIVRKFYCTQSTAVGAAAWQVGVNARVQRGEDSPPSFRKHLPRLARIASLLTLSSYSSHKTFQSYRPGILLTRVPVRVQLSKR